MADTAYVITVTHPDGTPYQDQISANLHTPSVVTVYTTDDRDQRVAAIQAAGLTPHVREA
ncbi:hypothetical protein OG689_10885 [Kitasatospora sp. NBC_00240]|uniref:hypothetical protein n=1 Tax=Kitasatospora sp. NBC_00240 TaxID=2903567 RepID=UPI002256A5D3|nr:hypothetical protein [Kitasatospora sp. NBC_00240]MCX5209789.1 hypothetical protein [Kitasatospora sp. NBC_00240]